MVPDLELALERGAIAVTANRRLARALRHQLNSAQRARAERGEGPRAWRSPTILTWKAWMTQLWREALYASDKPQKALLSSAQELLIWEQIIANGSGILQTRTTAAAAQHAWTLLHDWEISISDPAWMYHEDGGAFLAWAAAFRKQCEELNRIDAASVQAVMPASQPVYLVGFDELTPRQERFLGQAGAPVTRVEQPAMPAPIQRRTALANTASEIEAAAQWAFEQFTRDPEIRIGIVAPNLSAIRAQCERVFLRRFQPGKPFHIAIGPPLAERPIVAAILSFLELLADPLEPHDATRILLSPYWKGAKEERSARAQFDFSLREKGAPEWSIEVFLAQRACPPVMASILKQWVGVREKLPREQLPSAWSRAVAALLETLDFRHEESQSSEEYQAVQAWREILSQFASLDVVLGIVSAKKAIAVLRQMAHDQVFEVENLRQPIQILSIEEAMGSDFDALWVMGLQDEVWPPAPSPNPFIPIALQKRLGIPNSSPELSLKHARRATASLLASALEVVVSYPVSEGDRVLTPSPLITHLPLVEWQMPVAKANGITLDSFEDWRGPSLAEGSSHRGGSRLLQLQAACPFKAFAEVRLEAKPLKEAEIGLSPQERGTLLHLALQYLWADLKSSSALAGATTLHVLAAVDRALLGRETHYHRLERTRLAALLEAWLNVERERNAAFDVLPTEQEVRVDIGGLKLNTRTDRMDRLPGGEVVLIDYKSSSHSVSEWVGARPDDPQVPLYAISTTEPLAGVAFGQLKAGDLRFKGHASRAGVLPGVKESDLQALLGEWRQTLTHLATDFRAGAAAADPKNETTCRNCTLASLCRIHEAAE